MMQTHPSTLKLDELALGFLSATEAEELRDHLRECKDCQTRVDANRASDAQVSALVIPRILRKLETPPPRRSRAWLWPAFAAPAFATVALIMFARVPQTAAPEKAAPESTVMTKGGASLQVFARRGENVFAVSDGTRLRSGDAVRFVVAPHGLSYVLIASVDGSGKASVYFPLNGTESAKVASQERVELEGALKLDNSPGPERIFAIFSTKPLAATSVLAALAELGNKGGEAIRQARVLRVEGDAQDTILLEKAAP